MQFIQANSGTTNRSVLKIFNIMGELVAEKEILSPVSEFDLSFLSNGVYVLKLERDGEVIAGKIVKV